MGNRLQAVDAALPYELTVLLHKSMDDYPNIWAEAASDMLSERNVNHKVAIAGCEIIFGLPSIEAREFLEKLVREKAVRERLLSSFYQMNL